jgi:hypothetical protein
VRERNLKSGLTLFGWFEKKCPGVITITYAVTSKDKMESKILKKEKMKQEEEEEEEELKAFAPTHHLFAVVSLNKPVSNQIIEGHDRPPRPTQLLLDSRGE